MSQNVIEDKPPAASAVLMEPTGDSSGQLLESGIDLSSSITKGERKDIAEEDFANNEAKEEINSNTMLKNGAEKGDLEMIRKAIGDGANVNEAFEVTAVDNDSPLTGDYALHYAAAGGKVLAVKELLLLEAEVDNKNRIGSTALITACANNRLEVAKELLQGGANVAKSNKMGNTALHTACYGGFHPIVELLLNSGAAVLITVPNRVGLTPLDYADQRYSTLASYLREQMGSEEKKST